MAMTNKIKENWTAKVTKESNALDLELGVFSLHDPKRIARSLLDSAQRSKRRKATPLRSAMSMLVFYINRAGSKLDPEQRAILEPRFSNGPLLRPSNARNLREKIEKLSLTVRASTPSQ